MDDAAQLWFGFLHYYACQFDYKTRVVCIRQKEELTKFEKLWNSDTLSIEDPFDLHHNLGGALSKKSALSLLFIHTVVPLHLPQMGRNLIKGVMSSSSVDALSELCSPFLKGGNSAFIAAIASGLFPKNEYRSNNYGPNRKKKGSNY